MHAFEKSQSSKSAWSIMSRCIIMEDGFRKSLASLTDLNLLNLMLFSKFSDKIIDHPFFGM